MIGENAECEVCGQAFIITGRKLCKKKRVFMFGSISVLLIIVLVFAVKLSLPVPSVTPSIFGDDGRCLPIVSSLEKRLHDPSSFQHLETTFRLKDSDFYLVTMIYRSKNLMSALRLGKMKAKISKTGDIIYIMNEEEVEKYREALRAKVAQAKKNTKYEEERTKVNIERFNQLKELADREHFSYTAQELAKAIINMLSEEYGDFGVSFDPATEKITQINDDAQKKT